MNKILSIIIPTYNAAQFLDKGLSTFIMEDKEMMDKLEVLIVNDGTKDNSVEVAQKFVDRYPNTFKIINKENGGHGSAINTGVENVTGKYFKCVDADDWVYTDALERTMKILEKEDFDALIQSFITYDISKDLWEPRDIHCDNTDRIYNLKEIVDYLHNPDKYREIGASMPKGILLVGPPGTGKTMLAKAVAGEANVPFFSMSGSEFVEMFVGMGASKVRDLFRQAKEKAPCIVFIDEIDAIGKKRDGNMGGNDEREQTLNQLLTEMDGFEGNTGVIILAATNRPESLDPALTRPGRFDRRVPVELPDLSGREAILKVHAKKIKVSDNVDFNKIARMASGASGAELANIVNEAALRAVRDGRAYATQADLEESIEVVIAGYQKKNAILTDKEKWTVAYHEIGHALVAAKQTNSAPVQKITIIPRTSGALGYTMQVEEGTHYLMNKEEIENKIATLTGGRAAEEVVFDCVTTGASNDIEQATKLARAMITRYGMSEEFDMVALETVTNQYLGGDASLACSADTQAQIDRKVVELVRKQHEKAAKILKDNRAKLDELAKYLYDKETITGEEFMSILNAQDGQTVEN